MDLFFRTGLHTFPFTSSILTEARQYSNIVFICVRLVCILNFNFLLFSVPEIYTCSNAQVKSACLSLVKSVSYI